METDDLFAFAPGEYRASLWAGVVFTAVMVVSLGVYLASELGLIG